MWQEQLIVKLLDLEARAKAHSSEYLRLIQEPRNMAKASFHDRKVIRLRSRIQNLMRQIVLFRKHLNKRVSDRNVDLNP